jgi:predicted nucleic acid-binding protein
MAYLVDTGILLRLLDRNDPQHPRIREALRMLKGRDERLITTSQNIAEFWNVSTRPATARGGYGLSCTETAQRTRILERLFTMAYETPATYLQWRELVVARGVMGVQVHDARLVAIMQVHGIKHILTLNVADFSRYSELVATTPDHLIAPSAP